MGFEGCKNTTCKTSMNTVSKLVFYTQSTSMVISGQLYEHNFHLKSLHMEINISPVMTFWGEWREGGRNWQQTLQYWSIHCHTCVPRKRSFPEQSSQAARWAHWAGRQSWRPSLSQRSPQGPGFPTAPSVQPAVTNIFMSDHGSKRNSDLSAWLYVVCGTARLSLRTGQEKECERIKYWSVNDYDYHIQSSFLYHKHLSQSTLLSQRFTPYYQILTPIIKSWVH